MLLSLYLAKYDREYFLLKFNFLIYFQKFRLLILKVKDISSEGKICIEKKFELPFPTWPRPIANRCEQK